MGRRILMLWLVGLLFSTGIAAQTATVTYSYDAAGNRIAKETSVAASTPAGTSALSWTTAATASASVLSEDSITSASTATVTAAAGLVQGQSFGEAFKASFDGIYKTMAVGGALGMISTIGLHFAEGTNPFNGKNVWPKNNGFEGESQQTVLEVGTKVDRYGDDKGRFVAPKGTPYKARSLPSNHKNKGYTQYEVVKPLPTLQGVTAKSYYFSTPGGGTQYMFDHSIKYLLLNGYLKIIP